MTDNSPNGPSDLTPDFEPLYEVAKELGDEMVLDFVGRVGAHPYARWTDDGWEGISVGPFDSTDDGRTIICTTDLDLDDERVKELVEQGPVVQLVWYKNTPFDGHEPWVYGGLDEDIEAVDEE
jgi:hypothetical protein